MRLTSTRLLIGLCASGAALAAAAQEPVTIGFGGHRSPPDMVTDAYKINCPGGQFELRRRGKQLHLLLDKPRHDEIDLAATMLAKSQSTVSMVGQTSLECMGNGVLVRFEGLVLSPSQDLREFSRTLSYSVAAGLREHPPAP